MVFEVNFTLKIFWILKSYFLVNFCLANFFSKIGIVKHRFRITLMFLTHFCMNFIQTLASSLKFYSST